MNTNKTGGLRPKKKGRMPESMARSIAEKDPTYWENMDLMKRTTLSVLEPWRWYQTKQKLIQMAVKRWFATPEGRRYAGRG